MCLFYSEDLSSRVSQCEYSERRLQAELQVTQTELEKSNKMVDQLNSKLRELSDKFESMLDQEGEMKVK
jgi:chromosome segregation ATPase